MDVIRVPFLPYMIPWQAVSEKRLGGEKSAEAILKSAVFFSGVHTYWCCVVDPSARKSSEFLEDEAWIMVDDAEWPFSFINICKELGIDPVSLRLVLIKWKNSHSISK